MMRTREACIAGLLACVALLVGCGHPFAARVVPGPAGIARVVALSDARMADDAPGVGFADVRVLSEQGVLLGSGKTDAAGFLRLSLPEGYTGRIRIEAEADGYQRSASAVTMPPRGAWVLIVVREQ